MAWKTPRVTAGELHPGPDTHSIPLDTAAWFAWLADEEHRCFRFVHPAGVFTARKERKQRGGWYWIAYRQVRRKLYKTYLGRSETLTAARLQRAAVTLTRRVCRRALHDALRGYGPPCADRSAARRPRRSLRPALVAPECTDADTSR